MDMREVRERRNNQDRLQSRGRPFRSHQPLFNIGAYVDYSTYPQYRDRFPPYIISDISNTISTFLSYPGLTSLFQYFSLHEIIEVLLCKSTNKMGPGDDDYIVFFTEDRLGDQFMNVDLDNLILVYDQINEWVRIEIGSKTPEYQHCDDYCFYKWFDPVSICLFNESRF